MSEQSSEPHFITGLDLSESFYRQAVVPILRSDFSALKYAAALIGSGSEVLGLDTAMSADHHFGPRVMLFVSDKDESRLKSDLVQTFSSKLPRQFRGMSTSFSTKNNQGVQTLDHSLDGPINHRIEVLSPRKYVIDYLGIDISEQMSPADWLVCPQQKLLAITSGRVFHDDIDLAGMRSKLKYYPQDIWLYLLAACWTRIEQEFHLMNRAGTVGDELGSAVIGARLVRDIMRLCFLMEKQYAPYPKWLGTAFKQLKAAAVLEPILKLVIQSPTWEARQNELAKACEHAALLHNQLGITAPMPTKVVPFFDRPFFVISTGEFSQAICQRISDPAVRKLLDRPLIGNIDLVSDSTDMLAEPIWEPTLRLLYERDESDDAPGA